MDEDLPEAKLDSRRSFLKKGLLAAYCLGKHSLRGLLVASETLLAAAASLPERTEDGLAILCSEPDRFLDHIGMPFFPLYRARIETAFGYKAKHVITNATTSDFKRMIGDDSIDSLVILGHGCHVSWSATDKSMQAEDYAHYALKGIRKKGMLLKHTCGEIPKPGAYTPYALASKTEIEEQAKHFEQKYGIAARITMDALQKQEHPLAHLPMHNPDYAGWIVSAAEQRIPRELFGTPLFENERVAHWTRIASPIDFMIDPYARKQHHSE